MNVWLLFALFCAGIAAVGFWAAFSKSPGDDKLPGLQRERCYFAQFYPQDDGGYRVYFPDLLGCHICGDDLDESMSRAMQALAGYLETCLADGKQLPPASDFETARAKAREAYSHMGIAPHKGTLYLLVPANLHPEPLTRIDIAMQPDLLSQIDRQAQESGLSRSALLAAAARQYMRKREAA